MMIANESSRTLSDPITLAMAVVMDRISHLSKEDREDLCELSRIAFLTDSPEEERSATTAMLEILEQPNDVLRVVEPVTEIGDPLKQWLASVSKSIKTLRKNAGLTQIELSNKCGIPQSHISRLENGEHSPSNETLVKIARALEIPVSLLDPQA